MTNVATINADEAANRNTPKVLAMDLKGAINEINEVGILGEKEKIYPTFKNNKTEF